MNTDEKLKAVAISSKQINLKMNFVDRFIQIFIQEHYQIRLTLFIKPGNLNFETIELFL